ncbi:MAG TPA: hypothetical protein VG755_41025 [Nannocystaceae bacterium]|nr:hypothetical protein [Nannocystaceae bacterium]
MIVVLTLVGCTTADPERSPPGGHEAEEPSESSAAATTMPTTSSGASTSTTASDDTDADATSSSPSSTSAADDTTGSEGVVDCEGVCVSPPNGWTGPVVKREAIGDGVCDLPGYADVALEGYRDLNAPAATCGCECEVSDEATCDASLVRYTSGTCAALADSFALHSGCNNISDQSSGYFGLSLSSEGGACEAHPSDDIVPVEVLEPMTLCATSDVVELGCDGEQCVPQHGEDALCWWQEGDVDCAPALENFLESRTVLFTQEPTDTRDCSECTCALPNIDCSDPGVVMVTANQSCGFADFPSPVGVGEDDCEQYAPHSVHMTANPTATTACGIAEASAPIGAVEPQGAVTVCCYV